MTTSTSKRTFEVTAEREGKWWVFEIPDLDTGGQATSLPDVATEARNIAAAWIEQDADTIDVHVTVTLPDDERNEWDAAEAAERAARESAAAAAARRSAVVTRMRSRGWTAADVGAAVGLSKQRIYQIEKARADAT